MIAARAEIPAQLLYEILLKSNCRLHGEEFSPGCNSARAENPCPVWSNRAKILSPGCIAPRGEKISSNRKEISARAEKQEII